MIYSKASSVFKKLVMICLLCLPVSVISAQKLNESYLKARAALQQEQYPDAIQYILSIPAGDRSASMNLTLGESYYKAGKYSSAVNVFAAVDSMKSTPSAQLWLARSYASLNQPAKSTEWLQKYLGQRDKLSESELQLDPALEKIERSKEWRKLWEKEWYNDSEQNIAEVNSLIRRKKYTEALNILDKEINKRSSSSNLYALRAKTYEAMQQYEPAFNNYEKAIGIRSNHPEYFSGSAEIASRIKKYDVALDHINQAIRLDPYRLDLYLQKSGILRMLKRYDEARDNLNFYFTYLPSDTKALYQMGMAETEAGNVLTGIEYFTMLIDRDKVTADYYLARANAYITATNYGSADDDLAQVLDLNPNLPEAWLKKGIVLHQLNESEDACYYWRKALNMGNKDAAGYIYRHCNK